MKIIAVVGARPSFMKAAAFLRAIGNINVVLVHTGQHYDYNMSESILTDLLVKPDYNLNAGNHAGKMIDDLSDVYLKESPDCVVVFGDTNSTLAAALAARLLGIRLCHVEAGLRSGDMTMPEELNRVLTDIMSDLLLAPSLKAAKTLHSDKNITGKIVHVGNIMIDAMDYFMPYMKRPAFKDYCLLTLHRQSNVDNADTLTDLVHAIERIAEKIQIVWPMHPRAAKQLKGYSNPNIHILPPASYLDMLGLISCSKMIITDSGGIQAESTVIGVPCVTVRDSVEWEETIEHGTAVLADASNLYDMAMSCITKDRKPYRPLLWDGMAAERCVDAIWNRFK